MLTSHQHPIAFRWYQTAVTVPILGNKYTLKAKHLGLRLCHREYLPDNKVKDTVVAEYHGLPAGRDGRPKALGAPGDAIRGFFFVQNKELLEKLVGRPLPADSQEMNRLFGFSTETIIQRPSPLAHIHAETRPLGGGTTPLEAWHRLITGSRFGNEHFGKYPPGGFLFFRNMGNSNGVNSQAMQWMDQKPIGDLSPLRNFAPGTHHLPGNPQVMKNVADIVKGSRPPANIYPSHTGRSNPYHRMCV
jgi:hypothetical protein